MELDNGNTWIGAGAKWGGMVVVGAEAFDGVATRLDEWSTAWHEVNVTALRLGLGLGGSVGASLFFAFNAQTLWELDKTIVTDWGLNLAVPALKVNVKALGIALDISKYLDSGSKLFLKKEFIGSLTPEKIAKIRDVAAFLFNGGGQILNGTPGVLVLDIPGAGVGLEASLFVTGGELSVGGKI